MYNKSKLRRFLRSFLPQRKPSTNNKTFIDYAKPVLLVIGLMIGLTVGFMAGVMGLGAVVLFFMGIPFDSNEAAGAGYLGIIVIIAVIFICSKIAEHWEAVK